MTNVTWLSDYRPFDAVMNRLLVIGSGATVEECKQSGNRPNDPDWLFPVTRNFCSKLFNPTSEVLLRTTASYLEDRGIAFDPKRRNLRVGNSFTGDDMRRSPIGTFLELEARIPEQHNIERLCEHAWHAFGNEPEFWTAFVHDGIYLKLFARFTEQFGLGPGKSMVAGRKVAQILISGDVVLNLNYDIAFDLALKQIGKIFCYAPEVKPDTISVLKPHGSFNFYVNPKNGNCSFEEPDQIPGSVGIPDPEGGIFFPQHGIIPPRLNKSYEQHPASQMILSTGRPFFPKVVTFWGVGLTDSDIDLLAVYQESTKKADSVEFINPCVEAYRTAVSLLSIKIVHFQSLDQWCVTHNLLSGSGDKT